MSYEKQTLVNLTQSFIKILTEANGKELDLSFCERKLNTPKRRLYDIINVLAGVGLIQRLGKSKVKIAETQDIGKLTLDNNLAVGFNNDFTNTTNSNIMVSDHERELDMLLNKCEAELNDLSESELFNQFAFITENDIQNLDPEHTLFSINGPKELSVKMDCDPNDSDIHRLICRVENGEGAIDVQQLSQMEKPIQSFLANVDSS